MTDQEFLQLVRDERSQALGFENDSTLTDDRETALEYINGEMHDLPSLENRSSAVSTDVADAINTLLPDLVEIFTGEEVASFRPIGEEDVDGAQQETDLVNHVVFADNPGYRVLTTMFQDALQLKTGIVMVQWKDAEEAEQEEFEGTAEDLISAMLAAAKNGSIVDNIEESETEGLVTYTVTAPRPEGKVVVEAVAPEDFAVAEETVNLADAHYCAYRTRVRRSVLLADGYSADDVEDIPTYNMYEGAVSNARSQNGEDEIFGDYTKGNDLVEIVHHFVRVLEKKRLVLYKIVTAGDESILLEKERVNAIPFASVTPYMITHRFYGKSVADVMMDIQRIKTALLRLTLDSGYYSMNQRMEIVEDGTGKHTLTDLMDNRPGVPVRVKKPGTVNPLSTAPLQFDTFSALEYASTMGEMRSGIVRNAQGLNSDALHDTKGGMEQLINAAQKRIRFMARMFAETGVKDMFILVHALLRTHSTRARKIRIDNKFVEIDPTKWGARDDMRVEIATAGGREHDLVMLQQIIGLQERAVQAQGGVEGPLVNPMNLYAAALKFAKRGGFKAPEMFFTNPQEFAQAQAQQPPKEPAPDPALLKLQADSQVAQGRLQLDTETAKAQFELSMQVEQSKVALEQQKLQLEAQKAEADANYKSAKLQSDQELALLEAQLRSELAMQEMQLKYGVKAEQVNAELDLKGQIAAAEIELESARLELDDKHHTETLVADVITRTNVPEPSFDMGGPVNISNDIRPGGEPG